MEAMKNGLHSGKDSRPQAGAECRLGAPPGRWGGGLLRRLTPEEVRAGARFGRRATGAVALQSGFPARAISFLAAGFLILGAIPAQAARIGEVVDVSVWEQAARFFTFSDPALRFALVGALLLGASCGLLGSFLVVRRMALMGDAISHAVLPGVAAGYLWHMSKDPVAILIGATVAGLLGVMIVTLITQTTRVKQDAALGIVLASFFAIGVCAIKLIEIHGASGNISGIKQFLFGQAASLNGKDVVTMAVITALSLLLVVALYGPLVICSFDRGFAASIGLPVKVLDYLLMLFVTFAIVIALQAVGVVLVSALLIIPAATAYLLTDRMHRMLLYSALFGMLSATVGSFFSFLGTDLPTGPFMVVGASVVFAATYFFAPRHGTVMRWFRRRDQARRIRNENFLKAIHRILEERETGGEGVALTELAEVRRESGEEVLADARLLVKSGQGTLDAGKGVLHLTPAGHERAWQVVRNHRLWELYLTNAASYKPDHVHEDAERIEHVLGEEVVRQLARQLDYPEFDPHGKPIPSAPVEVGGGGTSQ
jgi:ABC-type Mn2+/Zn2+ transport system permease subunit/Mn-dependent DtxR family transcriptional regulator